MALNQVSFFRIRAKSLHSEVEAFLLMTVNCFRFCICFWSMSGSWWGLVLFCTWLVASLWLLLVIKLWELSFDYRLWLIGHCQVTNDSIICLLEYPYHCYWITSIIGHRYSWTMSCISYEAEKLLVVNFCLQYRGYLIFWFFVAYSVVWLVLCTFKSLHLKKTKKQTPKQSFAHRSGEQPLGRRSGNKCVLDNFVPPWPSSHTAEAINS